MASVTFCTVITGRVWLLPRLWFTQQTMKGYMFRLAGSLTDPQMGFSPPSVGAFLETTPTGWGAQVGPLFMDIMQNNEGPSIGKYLTEINCGGWHYSPGNMFQRQDTRVLRGSSLFTASDGGRKKNNKEVETCRWDNQGWLLYILCWEKPTYKS